MAAPRWIVQAALSATLDRVAREEGVDLPPRIIARMAEEAMPLLTPTGD